MRSLADGAERPRLDTRRFERVASRVLLFSLILPLPWQPVSWGFTVFPFVLVLAPLLFVWFVDASSRRESPAASNFRPSRDSRAVVAAAGFCSLLAFLSALSNAASARYACLLLYVAVLAAFCLMRLPTILELREVRVMIMVDVAVLASLAVIQFATNSTVGALAQYFQHVPIQNSLAYLPKGETLKRAQGTFSGTVILAQWLTYAIVFLFAGWCIDRRRGSMPTLLAALAALLFTFTRSAWLLTALACASLAWFFAATRQLRIDRFFKLILGCVLAGALVLALAPPTWTERLAGTTVESDLTRRNELSAAGIKVAAHFPALGIGYMRFLERAQNLGVHVPERPHNVFVQIASEQGLFVVGAFLLLIATLVSALFSAKGNPRWLRACGMALLGVWLAFMFVFDIAADYALLPTIVVLICVCIGYQAPRSSRPEKEFATRTASPRRAVVA